MEINLNKGRWFQVSRLSDYHVIVILMVVLMMKMPLITYGLPYSFHPDELYIYKTPFKIILEYSHFDFKTPTNLFFWLLTVWYSLGFIIGLVTGKVSGINDFQDLLLTEDGLIFLWGRIFSVLITLLALVFAWRLINKIYSDSSRYIWLLLFAANPIEWVSCNWIKFDPICYLGLMMWLYYSFLYFSLGQNHIKKTLYWVSILIVTVRVDLSVLMLFTFIGDFFIKKEKIVYLLKWGVISLICYSVITNIPAAIIISSLSKKAATSASFEQAIFYKYIALIENGNLFLLIFSNLWYYLFSIGLVVLLPLTICFLFMSRKIIANPILTLYLSAITVYLMAILVFPYHAPHYFLIPSVVIIAIVMIVLKNVSVLINYVASLTIAFYFLLQVSVHLSFVIFRKDTRFIAKEFVLKATSFNESIGLEGLMNNGFFPPIDECPEELVNKSVAIKKYNLGSGRGLELKSKIIEKSTCRKIIEISSSDRFDSTPYADDWINKYNASKLNTAGINWIVLNNNINSADYPTDFQRLIRNEFELEANVTQTIWHPGVKILLEKENYFPDFFIYHRLKPSRN